MKQVTSLVVKVVVKGEVKNTLQYDIYTRTGKKFFASTTQKTVPVVGRADVVSANNVEELKQKLMNDKFGFAYTYGVSESQVELKEVL